MERQPPMSDKAAGKQKARRLSEDEAVGPPASEGLHGLSTTEFRSESTVPTTERFRSGGQTRTTEDSPDTHGPVPAVSQAGTPRPSFHTHAPYSNTPSYFLQGPSPPYSLSPPFDISSHSTSMPPAAHQGFSHYRTNQASVAHPYPYSLPPSTEHEPSTYSDPYGIRKKPT
ncbi:uncharacterized protein C8Q71DRAFT_764522 [Rhodofomes roseus]|uniref:Uncharacterized protein n=1 Tax=Rhodofomes roseus TaxID=34475 RepID=A0ABQ8KC58_9APHY|nr:uncharacterized protein C8Q71DRAFT_764522 [Rhodofomes roseus]KAH9835184.1 hypothetical protein C8Q71DRAFT_764522 [Rhodofomes roseus]